MGDRMCPAYFERNPEMVDKFENLISECCTAQKGTRKLYTRLVSQEKQLHRNVEVLQQKLKIMRSMPDLSMPRRESASSWATPWGSSARWTKKWPRSSRSSWAIIGSRRFGTSSRSGGRTGALRTTI